MKTQSILAVLGATVALNLSAFAGPGPQAQLQTRSVSSQKSVPAASSKTPKAPTIAFGGTKSRASESEVSSSYVFTAEGRVSTPSISAVTGPHGTTYLYRW